MSFRNRLRLFFLAIVLLPMVVVGAVLFFLLGGTESGKADAGAAARTDVARQIYNDCLLYTSPSPRDPKTSRMPSSA